MHVCGEIDVVVDGLRHALVSGTLCVYACACVCVYIYLYAQ